MVKMPEQLPEQKVVVWSWLFYKMFEITPPVFLSFAEKELLNLVADSLPRFFPLNEWPLFQ